MSRKMKVTSTNIFFFMRMCQKNKKEMESHVSVFDAIYIYHQTLSPCN
jgi:hypothetical protein